MNARARRTLLCLLATLFLAGCITILQPASNANLPYGPVTAEVGFRSNVCGNTFRVTLDGADITSQFTPLGATPPTATLTNLTPGSHTLVASADTLQYWLLIPFCSGSSASVTFNVQAPPQPQLSFSGPNPLLIDAGTNSSLTVNRSGGTGAVTVTLASGAPGVAAVSGNPTIPAGSSSAGGGSVSGIAAGSATVTASANGYQNGSLSVGVRPFFAGISPGSGAPGSIVTVSGAGFVPGASVLFGGQTAMTSFVSASSLTATVPSLPAGSVPVSVSAAGRSSGSLNFQVLGGTTPAVTRLFRTSASNVQTFEFSGGSLQAVDADPATGQGGLGVVDVAFNGSSTVVRTSSGDVQSFQLSGGQLALADTEAARASGTGAAIAAAGSLAVRASDVGIETYSIAANGTLSRLTSQPVTGTVSATGVAVAIGGVRAVRAHATGIDVYDVSNPAAPSLIGSASSQGGHVSSVGVGVSFAGSTAVRSSPVGIEVFSIAGNGIPTRSGSFDGGVFASAVNTAVALDAATGRAVRAHPAGIEIYGVGNPTAPTRIGMLAGGVSTTGVDVVVSGTTAFRATNAALEAYDISNPASIPAPVSQPATASSIGVGLALGN